LSELAILSKKLISKLRVADQLYDDPGRPGGAAVQDQRQRRGAGEAAGIGGTVEFRTDVFDAGSIAALVERLERVLVAMTADSGEGS
jgi:hypothetical protein